MAQHPMARHTSLNGKAGWRQKDINYYPFKFKNFSGIFVIIVTIQGIDATTHAMQDS